MQVSWPLLNSSLQLQDPFASTGFICAFLKIKNSYSHYIYFKNFLLLNLQAKLDDNLIQFYFFFLLTVSPEEKSWVFQSSVHTEIPT